MTVGARAEGESSGPLKIGLVWLVRLRWLGAAGATTALVASQLGAPSDLNAVALAVAVGVVVATNQALARWVRRRQVSPALLGSVMAGDTAILTWILLNAGGAANPLTVLYLVQVTLAAILLGTRWTWLLVTLSIAGYGSLFLGPSAGHAHHAIGGNSTFERHLVEMFLAFALATVVVAHLVTRVAGALRARELDLVVAQERAARTERMAALTTLAAGAAHELGSPLGTIAVVARELEHGLTAAGQDDTPLVEDARLIRSEVARCREIIDQMNSRAVEGAEPVEPLPVGKILAEVRQALSRHRVDRLVIEGVDGDQVVAVPRRTFVQVLANLVNNGFDASGDDARVRVRVERDDQRIRFMVDDRGHGMPAELVTRAHEPFVTTKAPGKGMGLGLYLAQSLADRLGGRLTLQSTPGTGTRASLEIPS